MQPKYKEQWIVTINRKAFVINEKEKLSLEYAMKNGDRWFKTEKGDILSVSHVECVTFSSREIANKLPEGEKPQEDILTRKELHRKIQSFKVRSL